MCNRLGVRQDRDRTERNVEILSHLLNSTIYDFYAIHEIDDDIRGSRFVACSLKTEAPCSQPRVRFSRSCGFDFARGRARVLDDVALGCSTTWAVRSCADLKGFK